MRIDGAVVPILDEAKHIGRIGSEMSGGKVAIGSETADLTESELHHLDAVRQAMCDWAQQRSGEPGVPRRSAITQILKQPQQVEVLKVAEDRENLRCYCHDIRARSASRGYSSIKTLNEFRRFIDSKFAWHYQIIRSTSGQQSARTLQPL